MIPENNEIRIEVSTRCNYCCIICPPRKGFSRRKEIMSTELFKTVLDKACSEVDYSVLTFPGMGEPLMDPGLEDKIAYARGYGLIIHVLTNGFLLDQERFESLKEAGTNTIRVSMFGDSPQAYSKMHGTWPSSFKRVKRNLTKISKDLGCVKLIMTYNVVSGVNDGDVDSWIDYWKNKADLLEVWKPHGWAGGVARFRPAQDKLLKTCGRPFKGPLQVQVDGTVNMCCFDYDGKLTIGDLRTQTLKEIFETSAFNKIRDCHKLGLRGSDLICENCDQRNTDKSEVVVYNSAYDAEDRVNQLSTTYEDIT